MSHDPRPPDLPPLEREPPGDDAAVPASAIDTEAEGSRDVRNLFLGVGLFCLLLAVALFYLWNGCAAILAGLLGLFLFVGSFFKFGEAKCPSCQNTISSVDPSLPGLHLCHGCGRYCVVDIEKKALRLCGDDDVHPTPRFSAPLKEGVTLPLVCAACCKPATRLVHVSWSVKRDDLNALFTIGASLALGAAVPITSFRKSHSLQIPHCDAHQDGASVKKKDKEGKELFLLTRAHGFCQQYCESNGLHAAEA